MFFVVLHQLVCYWGKTETERCLSTLVFELVSWTHYHDKPFIIDILEFDCCQKCRSADLPRRSGVMCQMLHFGFAAYLISLEMSAIIIRSFCGTSTAGVSYTRTDVKHWLLSNLFLEFQTCCLNGWKMTRHVVLTTRQNVKQRSQLYADSILTFNNSSVIILDCTGNETWDCNETVESNEKFQGPCSIE